MIINATSPQMQKQTQSKNNFGAKFNSTCIQIFKKKAEEKQITWSQAKNIVKIHFDDSTKHLLIKPEITGGIIDLKLKNMSSEKVKLTPQGFFDSFILFSVHINEHSISKITNYLLNLNLKTIKDAAIEHIDPTIPKESTEGVYGYLLKAFQAKDKDDFIKSLQPQKTWNPFKIIKNMWNKKQ